MQRLVVKKLIIISLFIFASSYSVEAQVSAFRLKTADSLFQAKLYTQSFEQYQNILQQKQFSPAMLLKMAFIKEGLNQPGDALYYLNLYYLASKDKSVLERMEMLATKNNLEGYKNADAYHIVSLYKENSLIISVALAALMFLFFSMAVFVHRKKQRPVFSVIMVFFFGLILFAHSQAVNYFDTGIITTSRTYIMDGPSAGASVVSIIKAGHRVEIIDQHDVWLKIRWNDKPAYVKEQNLLPVTL